MFIHAHGRLLESMLLFSGRQIAEAGHESTTSHQEE